MRGRAVNAGVMGQMVYAEWFFVLKTGKYGLKMIFVLKIGGRIGKILKDVNKCLNRC